jgi:hypothetical protein
MRVSRIGGCYGYYLITYVFDGALFRVLRSGIWDPSSPRRDLEVRVGTIEVRWISSVRGQMKAS